MRIPMIFHKKYDQLSKEAIHCYLWLANELFEFDMEDREYVITRSKVNLGQTLDWKPVKVTVTLKELEKVGLLRLDGRRIILKLR